MKLLRKTLILQRLGYDTVLTDEEFCLAYRASVNRLRLPLSPRATHLTSDDTLLGGDL
jgi:hypothetical protein